MRQEDRIGDAAKVEPHVRLAQRDGLPLSGPAVVVDEHLEPASLVSATVGALATVS